MSAALRDTGAFRGDRMFVKGIEVTACHGVLAVERTRPQRFVVDVEIWSDLDACALSDDYGRAICYAEVCRTVVAILSGPSVRLIETLAVSAANELLRRFPQIDTVAVTVHKPQAPLPAPFADVGVSVTRQRSAPYATG